MVFCTLVHDLLPSEAASESDSRWREKNMDSPENVLRFFLEPFKWIDAQIEQGHSVLIHCLAGAHRAGSTGVAYCMYANKSGFDETLAIVKSIRPIVDPFGPLEELLRRLEAGKC